MSAPEKHDCRMRISSRFRSYERSISQGPLYRERGLHLFHLTEAKAFRKITWLLTLGNDFCSGGARTAVRLPPETTSISPATFARDRAFSSGVEYARRV